MAQALREGDAMTDVPPRKFSETHAQYQARLKREAEHVPTLGEVPKRGTPEHTARMLADFNYPSPYEREALLYDQKHDYQRRTVENLLAMLDQTRASLHGIEVPCSECGGAAVIGGDLAEQDPCPRCSGTGKVREGGLVERVVARFDDLLPPDEERLREALRQEIGDAKG